MRSVLSSTSSKFCCFCQIIIIELLLCQKLLVSLKSIKMYLITNVCVANRTQNTSYVFQVLDFGKCFCPNSGITNLCHRVGEKMTVF